MADTPCPGARTANDEETPLPDLIASFRHRLVALLMEFGDAVFDAVRDAKHIDVEDVRLAVLGPRAS